jgi:hypothetical protein
MDDFLPRRFFVQPLGPQQRQYEALRAVFVEGWSQKEIAHRYHYSHGTLRVLVRQFRAACAAGIPPPFSPNHGADGHPLIRPGRGWRGRTRPPWPTSAR